MRMTASGNEVVRNEIVRAMQEYYDETVLSIVGIPAFKCRGCQQVNTSDSVKHPYVIPVDALQLFFALKDRRLL
jgi:ureidoglycolate hydrolase